MHKISGLHITILHYAKIGLHWEMPDFTGVSWDLFVGMQGSTGVFYDRKFLYTITG